MSDCEKVRGFLNRYFKDELDKKKRLYVETHVKNCIMCCAEMEFAKKRASVSELLVSLQPPPSFFRRIGNIPQGIKQKIKKIFSKYPVALPTALILFFAVIPAIFYVKKNNFLIIKTEETKEIAQAAQDVKKVAEPVVENKLSVQSKIEKKEEKAELKKAEVKNEKIILNMAEKAKEADIKKQEEKADKKKTDIAKTEQAAVKKKTEEKIKHGLYRMALKSDFQPDIIFSKVESLSENSGAVILSTKGFMPDSSEKKEILLRIPEEKYEGFLSEMKNQFNGVLSKMDKDIKLSNDISKQEGQAFVLIEIN